MEGWDEDGASAYRNRNRCLSELIKSGRPRGPFWSRMYKNPQNGCWEWSGALDPRGYGVMWFARRSRGVHRIMAHLFLGLPWKSDLDVCHKCDNPKCVNPVHLFIGTASDNMQDSIAKGRMGSKTHCKLGHQLTRSPRGAKVCLTCKHASWRRWRDKKICQNPST